MDLLKALFTSRTRVKLLTIFMNNPDGEYFIRELTRMLNEQINSVRRELDSLRAIGLLKAKMKNRKKYFVVNKSFIFYPEFSSMIAKSNNSSENLVKRITKLGDIDLLVLSGILVGKQAPCDLLIVGNINRDELANILDEELGDAEPLKFTVLTKNDFLYRLQIHDKFIKDIIGDNSNVIALNKLEKVISS